MMQKCVNAYKAKLIIDALSSGQLIRAMNLFNSCGECPIASELGEEIGGEAEETHEREKEEEDRSYI